MEYHYIYCTENLINGKLYVGKHSTENLDDGYLGNGKFFKRAVKKHGMQNFRKHILLMCESADEAFEIERQLVDEDFVNDPNTYNLVVGGYRYSHDVLVATGALGGRATAYRLQTEPEFHEIKRQRMIQLNKRLRAEGKLPNKNTFTFAGKHHCEDSKFAIGRANAIHQKGEGNSNFGNIWISNYDLEVSRRVSKSDLQDWLSRGWVQGRKIKW